MSDESRTSGKMNGALAEADVSKIAELLSSDVSTSTDLVAIKRARAEMDVRGAVLTSAGRLWENAVWSAPTSSGGST